MDREEFEARAWAIFIRQRQIENAEASVALSHEVNCVCSICTRVKEHNKKEASDGRPSDV